MFGSAFVLPFLLFVCLLVLLIIAGITNERKYWKLFGISCCILVGLYALLSFLGQVVFTKKILDKDDYYGEYVIKRDFFKGKQSDWQYNSFRFEINENDSICFYVTDKESILKTYKGSVRTIKPYRSEVLVVETEEPGHHILRSPLTVYRSTWDFYLVFNSPKFSNVFFEKGKWKPIESN